MEIRKKNVVSQAAEDLRLNETVQACASVILFLMGDILRKVKKHTLCQKVRNKTLGM